MTESSYTFFDYQMDAIATAVYPRPSDPPQRNDIIYASEPLQHAGALIPIMYCALGLTGEAGEVADEVKKTWRNDMELTSSRREKIKAELGDVLWYIANLAAELNLDLGTIAEENIDKLSKRKDKGQLKTR